jgi:osmotically-inducible protein OsmY
MSIKHIGNLDDHDIEEGLNDFLRGALGGEYTVSAEYAAGVATLRGIVPSETAARAAADLVLAFDGVDSVVNLVVVGAGAAVEESHQPA